ncbi:MAG: hypothetical protein JWR89_2778 [Tardiphaga sp.]|uniref:hypothetical protein n=1 Tax=Tardiphaga sp. TaxID=1926292 RepID=UPI00262625B0|nr:hypothetical protein [Tardiphaga sp.]MDB5502876.1 hypothetical protein [Tardiphaga sp.]
MEASGWLLGGLFGPRTAPLSPEQQAVADRVQRRAEDLIEEFRDRREDIARDARDVFALLGAIPDVTHWNSGLKSSLSALVLAAVHQSERFGDGTGAVKRRFATDLVVRVLEKYNFGGLPFLSIQKTLLAPFVGILIDWSVEILNIHPACWQPVQKVKLPSFTRGAYDGLLRIALVFSRIVMWFSKWMFMPTRYERQLRAALKQIEPEAGAVLRSLPPHQLPAIVERLVNIVVQLGQVTAPYVGLVEQVLRLGEEFIDMNVAERTEAIFLMLRGLLLEAYANDELVLIFVDSPIGDYLLRAVVQHSTWVLAQNGLLLDPGPNLTLQ